ncbi:MAG: FAD-dependent oxidoreductase [Bdellovibrionales bacterium]|nr:FAD-dependent oxidoreductase [Bdellovibrionales bacterium]
MGKSVSNELEVVIVGDGVHGSVHAVRAAKKFGKDRVRLIGPNSSPLEVFKRLCANAGMDSVMRSPATHHLDRDEDSLREFARKSGRSNEITDGERDCSCGGTPARPGVRLFFDHCDYVCETSGVMDMHLKDKAIDITERKRKQGYRVETASSGSLKAERVILATGGSGMLRIPDWATRLMSAQRHVYHLLDSNAYVMEKLWRCPPGIRIGIVGAGMTGTQAAIDLAKRGYHVRLYSHGKLNVNEFDADPRYFERDVLRHFRSEAYGTRIATARSKEYPGSVTSAVSEDFERVSNSQFKLSLLNRSVVGGVFDDKQIIVNLHDGNSERVDMLLLATGYSDNMFDSPLIAKCAETFGLYDRRWGDFPVLEHSCAWRPGLFLSGPAAMPIVGPFAPNIMGAHMAADRIFE